MMNNHGSRVIMRTAVSARYEIKDLLVGLLSAELVAPSACIWLVSPWLRDVTLLDNRSAAFRGLGSGWARREIGLFDVLVELAQRGSTVVVVTLSGTDNEGAVTALRRCMGIGPAASRLLFKTRPQLHAKGLIGDDYCLSGSMNFTRNGIEHLDELVTYTTEPAQVGAFRIEFHEEYGGGA